MFKKIFFFLMLALVFFSSSIGTEAALLQDGTPDSPYSQEQAQAFAGALGYQTQNTSTPTDVAAYIITLMLSFVGTIFVILIIVSGFQWMTAGGNEETIKTSRKRIINATIGLVIVLAAFVITRFVLSNIQYAV